MTGRRGLGFGLLSLWLLAGCQTAPVSPDLTRLPPDDPRPAALLSRWLETREERVALRGSARLAVDAEQAGGDVHLRSKQRVVVARPGRLRVEVQGLLGTTVAVLAVDEAEYAFFEADSHRFESGPVHPYLLWEVIRLELTPEEAVGLLLGAPELPGGAHILAAHDAGQGRMRITLAADGRGAPSHAVDLDEQARLRRYAVWSGARAPEWIAWLDDYEEVGGMPLAHRVSVETRSGARAVVSLSSIELNPPLSPDIFRLDGLRPAAESVGETGSGTEIAIGEGG